MIQYLNHTKDIKLNLNPTKKNTQTPWNVEVLPDAYYADHSGSTESTNGLSIFLEGSLIAWESKNDLKIANEYGICSSESEKVEVLLKSLVNVKSFRDLYKSIIGLKTFDEVAKSSKDFIRYKNMFNESVRSSITINQIML